MSGEVEDWLVCECRDGMSVFSMVCEELCIMSATRVPLYSSVFECHVMECALMSPVMMLFVSVSRYWKVFVMSVSSVA